MVRWHRDIFVAAVVGLCLCVPAVRTEGEVTTGGGATTRAAGLVVGMNLSAVNDWNREWAFVDVFKHSRPWFSQSVGGKGPWTNGTPLELTKDGWPVLKPGQAAGTLMCRSMEGHYPGGVYVCTYEGTGELEFGFDGRVVRRQPHRIEVAVVPGNQGIYLRVDKSDPADPVRDIHVWMPGMEGAKSPFHPLFVERLRGFKVIRFMDWGQTNGSRVSRWSERTMPESARQSGPGGVAAEYMVDLCNELGADAWVCVPHLADEGYVRGLATLVRDRLRPGGKVYVEYSNEVWNGVFEQSRWAQQEAKRRGVDVTVVVAERAAAVWRVWREVFGADAASRVVRVAAGQEYGVGYTERLLTNLRGEFDAVSCAAYFFPRVEDVKTFGAGTTPAEVLASCARNLRETTAQKIARHGALARQWSERLGRHVPLVAYEGGQHVTPWGKDVPYAAAYAAAQTMPEMGRLYDELIQDFRDGGGELLVAFNYVGAPSKYGYWGHLQYQDEPAGREPKFEALSRATSAGPAVATVEGSR